MIKIVEKGNQGIMRFFNPVTYPIREILVDDNKTRIILVAATEATFKKLATKMEDTTSIEDEDNFITFNDLFRSVINPNEGTITITDHLEFTPGFLSCLGYISQQTRNTLASHLAVSTRAQTTPTC